MRAQDVLRAYGVEPNKGLGQNFLTDPNLLTAIVERCGVEVGDRVLEIGPGLGTLTAVLADHAKRVVSVEIDRALKEALGAMTAGRNNVEILFGDFTKMDLDTLWREHLGGEPFKVVANLPYYVTSTIVMSLLESGLPIRTLGFMVQQEVAERMMAAPGTKAYGALSVGVQYRCEASIVMRVPRGAFLPPPKVDSAVIRLDVASSPRVAVEDEKLFFKVVKAIFAVRRKTLLNALSLGFGLPKDKLSYCIESCGFSTNVRGEQLSLSEMARLTNILRNSLA